MTARGGFRAQARGETKMPNWCHSYMTVTGAPSEIARFKRTCIRVVPELREQAQLDFNTIEPMPDFADGETEPASFPEWYDWACKHWGTKSNACHFQVTRDEPDRYECNFDTAWTPPVPIWEKMGKLFPALMFRLWGHEPLMDFAFRGTIRDSTLDLREVPTVWSTVDPKTGATVSGTREEIEAVLGKHEVSAVSVGAGPPPEGL
jgi:hypothetical protein